MVAITPRGSVRLSNALRSFAIATPALASLQINKGAEEAWRCFIRSDHIPVTVQHQCRVRFVLEQYSVDCFRNRVHFRTFAPPFVEAFGSCAHRDGDSRTTDGRCCRVQRAGRCKKARNRGSPGDFKSADAP